MRHSLIAGLLLLLPTLAFAAPKPTAPAYHACRTHAGEILTALRAGDYDAAGIVNFNATMKTAIAAQMNQFWSLFTSHYGAFDHAGTARLIQGVGQATVIMPLVFAHGRENLHVTCNAAGEVVGLFLTPVETSNRDAQGG